MKQPAPATKIEEIEVLRGVAVGFVLYQHFGWLYPTRDWTIPHVAFWSGVDLFFAISGFVIAKSLLATPLTWRGARAFWIRRIWRLLPAAWLWLALMLVGTVVFGGAFGDLVSNVRDAIAAVFQIANFHYYACGLRQAYECGSEPQYWTLSLEEQFYLLLPLFLVLFGKSRWPLLLVAACAQIFTFRQSGYPILSMVRSDGLLLGVLIAISLRSSDYALLRPRFLNHRLARTVVTPSLLLVLLWLTSEPAIPSIYMGLIAVVSATLVWIASYDAGYLLAPGLPRRALTVVGTRSYGLYLAHIPCFLLTRSIFDALGLQPGLWAYTATAAIIIAVSSELIYRLVESPLRKHGRHLTDHSQNIAETKVESGNVPVPPPDARIKIENAEVVGAPVPAATKALLTEPSELLADNSK